MTAYTDPRYDVRHTHVFANNIDMAGATGVEGAASRTNVFRMPYKAKLLKFGIIPTTATVQCATTLPKFALKLESEFGAVGTELATFLPGQGTLAQLHATGNAPETATNIPINRIVRPCAITAGASAGSVLFFMDYQEVYVSA